MPPDISLYFGQYTYLVTELVFGSLAFGILWWAGALGRAGRTIVVLYPIGYVWDWYTLSIGIFAIQVRFGQDFLGIPIEEHVFLIVVPAVVLAVHEATRIIFDGRATPRNDTQPGA